MFCDGAASSSGIGICTTCLSVNWLVFALVGSSETYWSLPGILGGYVGVHKWSLPEGMKVFISGPSQWV